MTATDNRGPSTAELQRYIREKAVLVFVLSNGSQVTGHLRWFDENAFQIVPEGEQAFTILRSAVLGYGLQGAGIATVSTPGTAQKPAPAAAPKAAAPVPAKPTADATNQVDDFEAQMRAMEEAEKAPRKE